MRRHGLRSSVVRVAACAALAGGMSLAALGSAGVAGASSTTPSAPHSAPSQAPAQPTWSGGTWSGGTWSGGTWPPPHHRWPRLLRIWATYYGWFTNTPPGCTTAYLTGCAHGTGTYRDPITLASDPKEFPPGTRFYYPTVKKYFVMGDYCTTCVTAWRTTGHQRQVDLWLGGQGGTEFSAINCENALTQYSTTGPVRTTFVVNPPWWLPVSHQPLFTIHTNRCFGGAHSTQTYGSYQDGLSKQCLSDPTAAGTPGVAAQVAACTPSAASEDIGFEGDFLMVHNLCLAMTTPAPGPTTTSGLEWTRCTGGPREQFEVGTGPIEWIQYQRCVVQDGPGATTLAMAHCTSSSPPDQTWTVIPRA